MWLLQTVTDAKFVVIYAVDSNAEQIAVAFEPNGKGDYVNTRLSSLFLTSSYGKNNYIRNNIKNTWLILNMQKMTYRKLIPNCMSGWQLLTTNHLMMIGYHKTVIKATPYRAKIIVGFTKRGEMLLYDIVDITPTVFVMKKEHAYRSDSQQSESTSRNGAPFVAMISQFTAKNNPSTENNLNGPKSKDDTIFDDFEDEVMFTADGDIAFDGFGADAQRTIDVKEPVQEQGAEHAVYTLYNAAARTAEKAIKGHSDIQLDEQNYERIAEKLMRQLKTVTITIQINGLDSVTRAVCFFD